MTKGAAPICTHCNHYAPSGDNRCTAYPDGIPEGILMNRIDHRRAEGREETKADGSPILFDPTFPDKGNAYAAFVFDIS